MTACSRPALRTSRALSYLVRALSFSPIGSFPLVAVRQTQAATSTRLPLSPAPSVRGQLPPSPCPRPLPAPRRRRRRRAYSPECVEKLSEKSQRRLKCSPQGHKKGALRPILASV